ncbi:MAG: tRNA (adenosine(37)-N6)-threonylcarbamoyltransferase complex ATPase subunit type 1 TsaE [bacterium]|nr:tRNA (adenosine(37)-N6)-threonylcarbamoyltransferase complex ATPase subunit type 1 TsaE [bacterium]
MLHDQNLPPAEDFPVKLTVQGPDQTLALGRAVADLLSGGEIILLYGPLGAGKTCFSQGLCSGLNLDEEVVSPTFTLVNTYSGSPFLVHHLDFYRVEPEHELDDIGVPHILDEVFSRRAIALIEWPEPILPELGPHEPRVELLSLPGETADTRTWHLRGVPEIPEPWRDLFQNFSTSDGIVETHPQKPE